jgi:hypothetical protein
MSDRLSSGVDSEGDSSTADSECNEAEKSPQASASPFRCITTVSVAFSRALSWFSRASRYIFRSWNHYKTLATGLYLTGYGEAHIIVFHEFTATAAEHGAKHALAFAHAGILALLVLDVDIEGIAFEKYLQVAVVLQYGMCCRFVEHALKGGPPGLDKVGFEATHGLLLWWRWDDDTRIVVVELGIQPEEIAVAAGHGKVGVAVAFGSGLGGDRVLGVRAREVAHLVRVAHIDGEGRLRCLFDAYAGLSLALRSGTRGRLDWRRHSRPLGARLLGVIVVEVHRVHEAAQG